MRALAILDLRERDQVRHDDRPDLQFAHYAEVPPGLVQKLMDAEA